MTLLYHVPDHVLIFQNHARLINPRYASYFAHTCSSIEGNDLSTKWILKCNQLFPVCSINFFHFYWFVSFTPNFLRNTKVGIYLLTMKSMLEFMTEVSFIAGWSPVSFFIHLRPIIMYASFSSNQHVHLNGKMINCWFDYNCKRFQKVEGSFKMLEKSFVS